MSRSFGVICPGCTSSAFHSLAGMENRLMNKPKHKVQNYHKSPLTELIVLAPFPDGVITIWPLGFQR